MDRHELKRLDSQIGELIRHGSSSCIRQANSIMVENFDILLRFALKLTELKPKPKHTIADNYPAGGLTASEPCMFCVDFEKLQAENDRLKEEARWIPVSERLPKEGKCLVLCEGRIHEVVIRITNDEWEDAEGKSFYEDIAKCDIRHLGCILLGHDECITHWKPIILPEQALKGGDQAEVKGASKNECTANRQKPGTDSGG